MSDGDKERLIKKVMLDEPKTQHVEAAQRDAVLEEVIEALEARAKDRSEMASRGDEGAAYEADWTRSLYPLIRALKGNADLQDVVVASGRSEGIPAPAESASRVETRACYRECKGPGAEGCEYPRCLSGSASGRMGQRSAV